MAKQWNAISQNIASSSADLFEHNGDIWSVNADGKLYQYADGLWVQRSAQYGSTVLRCGASFEGKIYAGTNAGTLLEWEGGVAWEQVAPVSGVKTAINDLLVVGGILYATAYNPAAFGGGGRLMRWNGSNSWVNLDGQGIPNSMVYGGGGWIWVSFGATNFSGGFVKKVCKYDIGFDLFYGDSSTFGSDQDPSSSLVLGIDGAAYSCYEFGFYKFNTNLDYDYGIVKYYNNPTGGGIVVWEDKIWFATGNNTRSYDYYDTHQVATTPRIVKMLVYNNMLFGTGTTGILYVWSDPTKQYYNIADTWKRGIYSMVNIGDDWKWVAEKYHSLNGNATWQSVSSETWTTLADETWEYQCRSWRK